MPVRHLDQFLDQLQLARVDRQTRIEPAVVERGAAAGQVDRLALAVAAGEEPAAQRAPGEHAHPVALTGGQQRGLDTARQDRVRRLLGPEPQQPVPLRRPVRGHDVLRGKTRTTERADLARVHQIRQRAKGFLDVGRVIRPVDLVEVDPVRAEPAQALLDLVGDPPPRVPAPVRPVTHGEVDLGRQHDVVAPAAQRLAHDLLGLASAVHVRRVHEIDARVQRRMRDPHTVVMIRIADRAEHHGAKTLRTDLDARAAKNPITHRKPPRDQSLGSPYEMECTPAQACGSEQARHQLDRAVDFDLFRWADSADLVPETDAGINADHLLDQDSGRPALELDLRNTRCDDHDFTSGNVSAGPRSPAVNRAENALDFDHKTVDHRRQVAPVQFAPGTVLADSVSRDSPWPVRPVELVLDRRVQRRKSDDGDQHIRIVEHPSSMPGFSG